jgi:hypothetical protein
MKKLLIAGIVISWAVAAFAQATIRFNNRVVGSLVAPIYGVNPADPTHQQLGNTPRGFPAGTTVYGGAPLSGTNFTAQLWCAPGKDQPESSLRPAAGYCTAGLRTRAAAGIWMTSTDPAILPGCTEGSVATLSPGLGQRRWHGHELGGRSCSRSGSRRICKIQLVAVGWDINSD